MNDDIMEVFNNVYQHNRKLGRVGKISSKSDHKIHFPSPKDMKGDPVFEPIKYQKELLDIAKKVLNDPKYKCGKKNFIINAVTGSGKSVLAIMLDHLIKKKKKSPNKTIFCTPQYIINKNFENTAIRISKGGKDIEVNAPVLTSSNSGSSTVEDLKQYIMEAPGKGLLADDHSAIVCTHMTLVAAISQLLGTEDKTLTENQRKKKRSLLIKRLREIILWIDEAHHCGVFEDEWEGDKEAAVIANGLGKVVGFCLENKCPVNLITATLYRSDGLGLIEKKYRDRFCHLELPFDRYITEVCRYLKSFSYDFIFYKKNIGEAVTKLFAEEPDRTTIIYAPPRHGSFLYDKREYVRDTIKAINPKAKVTKEYSREYNCYYYTIKSKSGKILKVVDLIEENGRENVFNYINSQKQEGRWEVDVIIALGTFMEGADYPPISRIIINGTRSSMVQMVQMPGRGFRDFEGKENVSVYQVLPVFAKSAYSNKEKAREAFNNSMKYIVIAIVMGELFPPPVNGSGIINQQKEVTGGGGRNIKVPDDLWAEYFGEQSISVKTSVIEEVINSRPFSENENPWSISDAAAYRVLSERGVGNKKHREIMWRQLKAGLLRADARACGIDFSGIDIDLLEKMVTPWAFADRVLSKRFGGKVFREIRKKARPEKEEAEWAEEYVAFFKENKRYPESNSLSKDEKDLAEWKTRVKSRTSEESMEKTLADIDREDLIR